MFSWRSKKSGSQDKGSTRKPVQPPAEAVAPTGSDDDSNSRFLTGNSDVDRRTVEVLLKTIARVSDSSDDETLLEHIVDNSVELCGAERGFLILANDKGETRVHVGRTRERKSIADNVRFSTSVVKRVLETGEPMLATVQSDAEAIEIGRSVFDLKLRAVMCVPLAKERNSKSGPRGVLYVDSRAATREFTHRELDLFAALSQHITITLEKRRLHLESIEKTRLEQQMELAQAVQSGLMPRIPKDIPGLDIHGFYRPAERTSGDFFDFVKLKGGRLAVVVGDVSGHGVGPALISQSAQSVLRTALRMAPGVASAVTFLNQDLSQRIDSGTFLTLLLLSIAQDGEVEICNAGHHGPIVARGGEILTADGHSLALGFSEDIEYGIDDKLELQNGDVLLAFTDGLVEAHSVTDREQLFGEERVKQILIEHARKGSDAETITRALAEAAFQFAGGKHEDDITLVVIRKHE